MILSLALLACSPSEPSARPGADVGAAARLSSTAAQILVGPAASDYFGAVVDGVGDVNGDGYDDLVVSAAYANGYAGEAWLYYGSATGFAASADVTLLPPVSGYFYFGQSASGGDVNGDGYSDVVIGELAGSTYVGAIHVYFGSASGIATTPDQTVTGTVDAGQMGNTLDVGDTNGDGFADVLWGAPWGSVHAGLLLGSASGIDSTSTATWVGVQASLGWDVAIADLDGDGAGEVALGESGYNGATGRVYVYNGAVSGWSTAWATLDGTGGGDQFGDGLEGVGDVDGDGFGDLAVGATYGPARDGQMDVFGGGASLATTPMSTVVGLSGALAKTIAGPGDVDGDGYADVLYGGSSWSSGAGYVEVELGSAAGLTAATFTVSGAAGDALGTSVAAAGDVNGDGAPDFAIGAPTSDSGYGSVQVFYGDVGEPDTGTVDTGTGDTGTVDTGTVDTGTVDTGPVDTGPVDTGDTGPVDAGDSVPVDSGTDSGGDTGPLDSGADTGTGDTDGAGDDTGGGSTEGCACSSGGDAGVAYAGMAAAAALLLARRRR